MENKIKTFEEALEKTGRPSVPEFTELPEDLREYFKNQYKAVVITEALNDGWEADWEDGSQKKWIPFFYADSASLSGFAFNASSYCCSNANAGCASRLCFKDEETSDYAGENFTEVFAKIILK